MARAFRNARNGSKDTVMGRAFRDHLEEWLSPDHDGVTGSQVMWCLEAPLA
jgi:hypothetical protein